jgi:hypothetical protein
MERLVSLARGTDCRQRGGRSHNTNGERDGIMSPSERMRSREQYVDLAFGVLEIGPAPSATEGYGRKIAFAGPRGSG